MKRFNEDKAEIPIEFLSSASKDRLQEYELMHLNHAANLEKEVRDMQIQIRHELVLADMARILIENREALLQRLGDHLQRVSGERLEVA